jgi:hypothetical protein
MQRPFQLIVCLIATIATSLLASSAQAQGILWSLPAAGGWVRFEGDYRQTDYRPENNQGDLNLSWRQHLEIRSVGSQQAEYNGETVECRWIEIESTTGSAEGEIKSGPGGQHIYKILVPESAVTGQSRDNSRIANEYLPIVKGYQKTGEDPVRPIESGVFQAYPVLALLRHYQDLTSAGGPQSLTVPAGTFEATQYEGTLVSESDTSRTTNKAQIYATNQVPFGLAKWSVQIDKEQRASSDTRDGFKPHSQIRLTMDAHEVGTGAQSKIIEK